MAGRTFTWSDTYDRRQVVVVSENFAREQWGSANAALGKHLRAVPSVPWREVVGVVGDVHHNGLNQPAPETVYFPVLISDVIGLRTVSFVIRSERVGTAGFLADVQAAIWSVNHNLPLGSVKTLGDLYQKSVARTSLLLLLMAITSAMALLLGVIGIYGVISYAVSQRTREVGIRIALGASSGEVRGMFLQQGLLLTVVGVAVGLAGAIALTRWMSSLLFDVSPLDPVTYAAVSAVLIVAAASASYLPSRRATRVDPTTALRAE